jgi:hypothetical protein
VAFEANARKLLEYEVVIAAAFVLSVRHTSKTAKTVKNIILNIYCKYEKYASSSYFVSNSMRLTSTGTV